MPTGFGSIGPEDPNIVEIYDDLLGGPYTFAVDREGANERVRTWPQIQDTARVHRMFLGEAVRYRAGAVGVRQFLDIGSGAEHGQSARSRPRSRPRCRVRQAGRLRGPRPAGACVGSGLSPASLDGRADSWSVPALHTPGGGDTARPVPHRQSFVDDPVPKQPDCLTANPRRSERSACLIAGNGSGNRVDNLRTHVGDCGER